MFILRFNYLLVIRWMQMSDAPVKKIVRLTYINYKNSEYIFSSFSV